MVYFTDALDEYLMANMPEYDDRKFQDVTKDDLKIGKDKAEKKREKKVKVCISMETTSIYSLYVALFVILVVDHVLIAKHSRHGNTVSSLGCTQPFACEAINHNAVMKLEK